MTDFILSWGQVLLFLIFLVLIWAAVLVLLILKYENSDKARECNWSVVLSKQGSRNGSFFCSCVCVCADVYIEVGGFCWMQCNDAFLLPSLLFFLLEGIFHWTCSFLLQLIGHPEPPDPSVPENWDYRHMLPHTALYMGARNPSSGPHVFPVSTLPTELPEIHASGREQKSPAGRAFHLSFPVSLQGALLGKGHTNRVESSTTTYCLLRPECQPFGQSS